MVLQRLVQKRPAIHSLIVGKIDPSWRGSVCQNPKFFPTLTSLRDYPLKVLKKLYRGFLLDFSGMKMHNIHAFQDGNLKILKVFNIILNEFLIPLHLYMLTVLQEDRDIFTKGEPYAPQ